MMPEPTTKAHSDGPWLTATTNRGNRVHAIRALYRGPELLGYRSWCGRLFVARTRTFGEWPARDEDWITCATCFDGMSD
jgi:hypothetical protein